MGDMPAQHDRDLVLLDPSVQGPATAPGAVLPLDDFVALGLVRLLLRHAWRHRDVSIRTYDVELIRKPFNKAVLVRLLARRRCWLEDESGATRPITVARLLHLLLRRVRAGLSTGSRRRAFFERIARLESAVPARHGYGDAPPLYLRTDLVFGVVAGGSVTHISGVINQLDALVGPVRMVTTDLIPLVSTAIETHVIRPDSRLNDVPELNALLFNEQLERRVLDKLDGRRPRFIYQRYSVNNVAGALLAQALQVPLVLEYNGSEVWINRHWGKVLADEESALRLEVLNLKHAALVVVVSQVLADELHARGVPAQRILVNPNGVDPDTYRPDIAAGPLRQRLGVDGQTVIGFIGTFGPWHGAAMLVDAFARLLSDRADLRPTVRLLMIGDGQQLPQVRRAIADAGLASSVILTGRVPQTLGPEYLAACDILVSPHVPNPDGSAFFGSPTKLFEYMAMGRPIVASRLDQIGDVLTDGVDALLVPPGEPDVLANAIARLIDAPALAQQLASRARAAALERHTWKRHTERILQTLQGLVDDRSA